MLVKRIAILAVGKVKTPHWRDAADLYRDRLKRLMRFEETDVRDGGSSLPPLERSEREGKSILAALRPDHLPIAMDEKGRCLTSPDFARFLAQAGSNKTPCLIIGGAYGLSDEVRAACRHSLSLGPMTFPHELARVILLEQVYRADCILRGSPYHHV